MTAHRSTPSSATPASTAAMTRPLPINHAQDNTSPQGEALPKVGQSCTDTEERMSSAGPTGVLVPQRGRTRGTRRHHPEGLW